MGFVLAAAACLGRVLLPGPREAAWRGRNPDPDLRQTGPGTKDRAYAGVFGAVAVMRAARVMSISGRTLPVHQNSSRGTTANGGFWPRSSGCAGHRDTLSQRARRPDVRARAQLWGAAVEQGEVW